MLRVVALIVATITVIIVLIIVYLLCRGYVRGFKYWKRYVGTRLPRVFMTKVFPTLKTGDLLFFIPFVHGFTNSMMTGDIYSHAAMIVCDENGHPFVAESTEGTRVFSDGRESISSQNGADRVPLLTRLKHYGGTPCLVSLSKPLDDRAIERVRVAAATSCPYPPFSTIFRKWLFGSSSDESRHCFQHVAHLLSAAGLCDLSDSGFIDVATAVTSLPGKKLANGYKYSPPSQIVYDIT